MQVLGPRLTSQDFVATLVSIPVRMVSTKLAMLEFVLGIDQYTAVFNDPFHSTTLLSSQMRSSMVFVLCRSDGEVRDPSSIAPDLSDAKILE